MAKPKNQEQGTKNQEQGTFSHTVRIAPPEDIPAILTTMERDAWQLLHIVPCAGFNHAAYFRRVVA